MAKVGHLVKNAMIQEASAIVEDAPNLIVVSVSRLGSMDSNELRNKLFESDASLHIVKRRIGKRVLDAAGTEGLSALADSRNGSVGLVVVKEDAVRVAKHIVDFAKAHEEELYVRGGILEGRLVSDEDVKAFADLPTREVLLAQVIGTVEAPINDVCTTVERLISDLIWAAEQAAEKVPASAAPAETSAPAEQPESSEEASDAAADTEEEKPEPETETN